MKKIVCLTFVYCLINFCYSQTTLTLTTDKTTSLIFPYPVTHVDRGTRDVLVQQVKEASNILLVKAAAAKFFETNLSVVTEDGSVYAFKVGYQENPETFVWQIPVQTQATLATFANAILVTRQTVRGISCRKWDMKAEAIGIYVKDRVIYYQLRLKNQSPIDYDIDFLHFCIRDKKKGKRTAIQENELAPLHVAGNTKLVKAGSNNVVVAALEKFTIPDAKFLAIQIMEKNGGRHLLLSVRNNKIMKAIQLPDLK